MRTRKLKRKRSACGLCKPHKRGMEASGSARRQGSERAALSELREAWDNLASSPRRCNSDRPDIWEMIWGWPATTDPERLAKIEEQERNRNDGPGLLVRWVGWNRKVGAAVVLFCEEGPLDVAPGEFGFSGI